MANNTPLPLPDLYATLHITRPTSPEDLFLAFQSEMLSLTALPAEEVLERFDQVSTYPFASPQLQSQRVLIDWL
jgi:hypothetical protein